jgi:hypothetical protein
MPNTFEKCQLAALFLVMFYFFHGYQDDEYLMILFYKETFHKISEK